jgi:hypothetical protein
MTFNKLTSLLILKQVNKLHSLIMINKISIIICNKYDNEESKRGHSHYADEWVYAIKDFWNKIFS